jgi:hypothetical protein
MRRALLPINLSDQGFSTDRLTASLKPLMGRYDRIVILVSDHLQLYKMALAQGRRDGFGPTLCSYYETPDYLSRRNMWVKRLVTRLGPAAGNDPWEIVGVETMSDGITFQIFRNVMLAFYSNDAFRQDVLLSAEAVEFAHDEHYPLSQRVLLSQGYVLEEIAISLRLHVFEGIFDGYYMTALPMALLRLYRGDYGFSVHEIAETPHSDEAFHFYRKAGHSSPTSWLLYPCVRQAAAEPIGEPPLRVVSS